MWAAHLNEAHFDGAVKLWTRLGNKTRTAVKLSAKEVDELIIDADHVDTNSTFCRPFNLSTTFETPNIYLSASAPYLTDSCENGLH